MSYEGYLDNYRQSDVRTPNRVQAVAIARRFHDVYEGLASSHGWSTNPKSRVPWEQVPEENRTLMLATVEKLLVLGVIAGPDSVMEGWWHPNVKSGQVHEHPEQPNGNWSSATHRLCEPVFTHRADPSVHESGADDGGSVQ